MLMVIAPVRSSHRTTVVQFMAGGIALAIFTVAAGQAAVGRLPPIQLDDALYEKTLRQLLQLFHGLLLTFSGYVRLAQVVDPQISQVLVELACLDKVLAHVGDGFRKRQSVPAWVLLLRFDLDALQNGVTEESAVVPVCEDVERDQASPVPCDRVLVVVLVGVVDEFEELDGPVEELRKWRLPNARRVIADRTGIDPTQEAAEDPWLDVVQLNRLLLRLDEA